MPTKFVGTERSSGTEAAVAQLVALGSVNDYISAVPETSPFLYKARQTTNFVHETIPMNHDSGGVVSCGREAKFSADPQIDIIYDAHAKFTLPAIAAEYSGGIGNPVGPGWGAFPILKDFITEPATALNPATVTEINKLASHTGDPKAVWVNGIAFALMKKCFWEVSGQCIDSIEGRFLYIWDEITSKVGKRLTEQVGRFDSVDEQVRFASRSRVMYLPLCFDFCKRQGEPIHNSLLNVRLQFTSFKLTIALEQLQYLAAVALPSDLVVDPADPESVRSQARNFYRIINLDTNQPLQADAVEVDLDVEGAYLDSEERAQHAEDANGVHPPPIDQIAVLHESQEFCFNADDTTASLKIEFNHPSLELIWSTQEQYMPAIGQYFRLSPANDLAEWGVWSLKLNNSIRFHRESEYFRLYQMHVHHSNIPENKVACYSFSLEPECAALSSTCNFSRIDNSRLTLAIDKDATTTAITYINDDEVENRGRYTIMIYDRFYNIIRYDSGLCGLAFAS